MTNLERARDIEWQRVVYAFGQDEGYAWECPVCHGERLAGHREGCRLDEMIQALEGN